MPRGLLLDIGGVVIRTPFEMLEAAERRHGLEPGALGPRGPFGLDDDPEFAAVITGDLEERAYWSRRAQRAADLLGTAPTTDAFIREIFEAPEDEVVRPETRRLIEDARCADLVVGALTNDLHDFHGRDWVGRMTIFATFEVLVDGSETGVLKPDPKAYELAVEQMGLPPNDLVLLDDQPVNAQGAEAAGITTVQFDPVRPDAAIDAVRDLLELPR